jgi:hypothetical protein
MKKYIFICGIYFILLKPCIAECKWVTENNAWIIETNPAVKSIGVTDGAVCSHRYVTGRSSYTASYILKAPKNGKLIQLNVSSFDYTPNEKFKGHDSYIIKICGTSNLNEKGCATITYEFEIR